MGGGVHDSFLNLLISFQTLLTGRVNACGLRGPMFSWSLQSPYQSTHVRTFLLLYFCRRVVAVGVDPGATAASDVMTPNPTTVLTEDSAMEALSIMLGRHFRHLPVRRERSSARETAGSRYSG